MNKIENNFIRSYGGEAMHFDCDCKTLVRNNMIYGGKPSFWRSPLIWIAISIIDRHFFKEMRYVKNG